jgi:putative transposase
MYYYKKQKDDSPVIEQLELLAEKHPTKGFTDYYHRIRNKGYKWNHKRIKRVYNNMQLNIRRKHKRRLPERIKQPLHQTTAMNESWSMDFMQDSLMSGIKFRVFNVIDDFNREDLLHEIDTSLSGKRIKTVLERLIIERGKPKQIRSDNGPEFISNAIQKFCTKHEIHHHFIEPGKPTQNAYIERFNRTFRRDVLDAYLFESIAQVKTIAESWMKDYNENHPHQSLQYYSPRQYALGVNSGKLCSRTKAYAQFTTINSNDGDDELF